MGERIHSRGSAALLAEFGARVRRHRRRRALTQEQLAEACGVHRMYVSSLERGARNPTVVTAHRLARALGLAVTELFDG